MTASSTIHIATTCNDAYFQGLCVTVLSALVANDSGRPMAFHIFDTGLCENNCNILREAVQLHGPDTILIFIPVSGEKFEGLTLDYGGGVSTYIRILMGSLINHSRVIYIDSDFLVLSNLADVYDRDLSGKIILASKDVDTADGMPNPLSFDCPFIPPKETTGFYYYNCGFLLVNLDAWRTHRVEDACFDLLQDYEGHLKAWDQTVLNYVLMGRIGDLEPSLCWSYAIGRIPIPGNIHFISRKKPWNSWSPIAPYKLWYLFHRCFLSSVTPLSIPLFKKTKGLIQYYRDLSLATLPLLGFLYLKYLASRKTPQSVALYDSALTRCRTQMRNPQWQCKDLLGNFKVIWKSRRNITLTKIARSNPIEKNIH